MKSLHSPPSLPELDATDRAILDLLQDDCKQPLAAIGEKVGLKAPAVVERIHKLEEAGVIIGYAALVDARRLGRDVAAFIGVSTQHPRSIRELERHAGAIDSVLECHHVTGGHTLMLKVKTRDTQELETLIDRIRSIEGVSGTETMVVLSTHIERTRIVLDAGPEHDDPRVRRSGTRSDTQVGRKVQ
jgi:Lrp/AsnC family leucine-responsive transcriptional regulator